MKEYPGNALAYRGIATSPRPLRRRRLPDNRKSITKKFRIQGDGTQIKFYLTAGLYPTEGNKLELGEIFVNTQQQGSLVKGLLQAVVVTLSIALQHGVPLSAFVRQYVNMQFTPGGFTGDPEIPSAKSPVDYIGRWLAHRFLAKEERREIGIE